MFSSRIKDFGVFLEVRSIARDRIITYKELLTNPRIANLLYVDKVIIELSLVGYIFLEVCCVFQFVFFLGLELITWYITQKGTVGNKRK